MINPRSRLSMTVILTSSLLLSIVNAQEPAEKKEEKKGMDIIALIASQRRKADLTQATSNAKQLFYLMIEFDQDWGHRNDCAGFNCVGDEHRQDPICLVANN